MLRVFHRIALLLLFGLMGGNGFGQVYFDRLYLTEERGEGLGIGTTQALSYGYVNWNNGVPNGQNYSSQSIFITDFEGNLLSESGLPIIDTVNELNANMLVLDDSSFILLSFQQILGGTVPGDIILRKVNDLGVEVWKQEVGEVGRREIPQRFCSTTDGGYAISGQLVLSDSGSEDGQLLLIKTDGFGNQLWEQHYGGGLYDAGGDVIQTPDNGFLLLGWTRSFGAGQKDWYLVKTDSLGNEEWYETYGTSANEIGKSILSLSDGNYLLTGSGTNPGATQSLGKLVKINPSGDIIWSNNYTYQSNTGHNFHKTVEIWNGDLVIAGLTDQNSNSGWLVRTDSLGDLIWQREFDKNEHTDLFYSVLATDDGGFLLSGQAINDTTGSQDAWLLKVDSIGCPYPNCLVGIDELGSQDVLVDVWPNPANDVLHLEVGGWPSSSAHRQAQGDGLSVTVVDMQGRVVCVDRGCRGLSDLAMTGTGTIDVSDWPNGLYVFTLTTERQQASVRVVVQH